MAAVAAGQSVSDLARKAPPELFADAVIKLVERGQLPPSALLEAFEAAKQAKEPVRLIAMPNLAANRRAGLREAAGALQLDTLSLESRAVRLLAATDPAKARELFQSVEHPRFAARPCEDPMIADASAYYEMAASVARAADLLPVVGLANSPGELASFAKVLAAIPALTPDEFRLLTGALGLKMETAASDYRSFTMTADELREALEKLANGARELGVPADALRAGARKLATTQLESPRCHEEFGDAMAFVEWFNGTFHGKLAPIREEETFAKKALGWAQAESYFTSAADKEVANAFQGLRMMLGKPEWSDRLADFLRDFSLWKPAGAEIDAFHQKMTVLHGLYQLIPSGKDRDKLATLAIEFLRSSGVEREYPAEWLLQVRSFAESASGDRAKLFAAFRESGDSGLALFAALNP